VIKEEGADCGSDKGGRVTEDREVSRENGREETEAGERRARRGLNIYTYISLGIIC